MSHPLQIGVLGPLEVSSRGDVAELPPSRKARALLGYLVATGRAHGRSALCDLFWEGVTDPRAGLRWALSRLRSSLDTDGRRRVVASRDRVRFEPAGAEVDLHRVRALVGQDPGAVPEAALKEAATLFRGAFLEGLDLPGCHGFQAWCLGERERLRSLQVSIHGSLTTRLRGDPEAALTHALTRLSLDAFSEDAHVVAIEVLGDLGRLEQGLEVYERCRRMLERRLGVPPSGALMAARRRLTPGPDRPRRSEVREATGPDDLSALLAELSSGGERSGATGDDVPLVGRAAERASLTRILEVAGTASPTPVVFVSGEPGIGKSRLLGELAREVRKSGGWVLSGAVFETEEVRPYGPWVEMLRGIPATALDAELRSGLAGLLPGAAPGSPEASRPAGPVDRTQLFDAVRALLARMADARSPGLVILDDVQWLDASSVALLHYVARNLDTSPIAFAVAGREEEMGAGSALAALLRSLDDRGHLHPLPLDRLGPSDTRALVRAVNGALDPEPVIATSEGNPYFALALAAARREGADTTPATVAEALSERLDRLDPAGLTVLPWAAALGRVFDVATLVHVLERPVAEVVEAIDGLERRGILRAADQDRYDFTHSLLRRAAYRRPSEPARRAIHRAIARRLDLLDRTGSRAPGAVAHHAELGGLPIMSVRACMDAAEESLWVFAYDEASELATRGLGQVARLPHETRIPLEMGLLRIYSFRSMRNLRPADLEERVRRLTSEAVDAGLREVVARGHALLMELQYQRGAFQEAGASSVRSAEAGRRSDPETATRALAETAACLLILDQAPEDARRLATEAVSLAGEHRIDVDAVALATALLHHHDGRLDLAAGAFRDVIRIGRQARTHWWSGPALTRMIMVDLDRGDFDRATARAREAEEFAERMGDEEEASFARGLGAVAVAMEEPGTRLEPIDAAVQRLRELDSLWKIAQVQAYAAELELARGRTDTARQRATETLEAASPLEQPSLLAVAHGLLARCDIADDRLAEATRRLDGAGAGVPRERLSHRARAVLRRAGEVAGR